MVMTDDPELNIKFVAIIEKYPCLYDYTSSDYSNRAIQDAAWDKISKEICKPKNDCKERWKNLRGCYTRHLKYMSTPFGPGVKLKKTYYLAEHLEFLKPFTKTRSRNFFSQSPSVSNEYIKEENELHNYYDSESQETQTEKMVQTNLIHEIPENKNFVESNTRKKIKQKSSVSLLEINKEALEYFRSKKRKIAEKSFDDADLAFLTSVLPDMKEMNSDQKRRFKIGILTLAGQVLNE